MKVVKLQADGQLLKRDLAFFGGAYSFLEKIRRRGVGSSKVIYEKGIPAFDEVDRGLVNELGFVNFELLKDGLLLRLNQNQRTSCVGIRLSELTNIDLVAFRIELRQKEMGRWQTKIIHRGELAIWKEEERVGEFSILSAHFKSLLAFFKEEAFKDKFSYSVSTAPPEKDYSHLLENLGGLLK